MKSFVFGLLLLQIFGQTFGWGENGHKIIAQIGWNMLSSNAQNLADQFIGSETFPELAPGPDDYDHTPQGKWSAPCHYVNMPRSATHFDLSVCDGVCCVVNAIMNYTNLLTGEVPNPIACNFDQGAEPCPLEFLVHFVGDSHQPLHVGYGDDAGGNEVQVTWYGTETNLHKVWDDEIIASWDNDWEDAVNQLQTIMQSEPSTVKYYASITDPSTWADESFQYVQSTCYNFTGSERQEPSLGDVYYNRNLPIVQQRLIAAGVRLATLINTLFTGKPLFG